MPRKGPQEGQPCPHPGLGQAPPGSQASSRGEAKDSALLSSRDAGLLEPPEYCRATEPTALTTEPMSHN